MKDGVVAARAPSLGKKWREPSESCHGMRRTCARGSSANSHCRDAREITLSACARVEQDGERSLRDSVRALCTEEFAELLR